MKNKQITIMLVTLSFLLLVGFSVQAVAGNTYNLGLSLAITGPTSDAGNPYSKGVEDYIKYANETKILGDDKINCPIKDDQYQTANAKRNFEEFLDQDIVLFLSYATGSNQALAKDYTEEQIPVIPASFDKSLISEGTGSEYIFLSIPSYSHQFVGLGEYVAKHHQGGGTPKVALFIHPSAFGRAPVERFKIGIDRRAKTGCSRSCGTRQGSGQQRSTATATKQGCPVRDMPDSPISCGHSSQGCRSAGYNG